MSEIEVLRESDTRDAVVRGKEDPAPTPLVWAVRLLSLGVLGFIVGYLVYMVITDTVPAQFVIEPDFDAVEPRMGRYVLPVTVTNDSTEAVTDVGVEVRLDLPGEADDETISFTIPLMGEGERAEAEVLFAARPTDANTELAVTSYQSP